MTPFRGHTRWRAEAGSDNVVHTVTTREVISEAKWGVRGVEPKEERRALWAEKMAPEGSWAGKGS